MNKQEEKEQFFGNYTAQPIMRSHLWVDTTESIKCIPHYADEGELGWYLLLKPLTAITDEDCLQVTSLIFENDIQIRSLLVKDGIATMFNNPRWNIKSETTLAVYDFLRSRGYAIPFRQYSVEDMISKGWIKLVE
jgi:hypothetical protein